MFAFAGQTIDIQARLPGDFVLSGRLASINLTNLVTDLCGPVLTLPGGFPAIILPTSDLTLAAGSAAPSLTLNTNLVNLGAAVVVVEKAGANFGAAAGFAMPDDWKFSKISPLFTPLNALKIGTPALAISSFDSQDFTFPGTQGERLGKGLTQGVRVTTAPLADGPRPRVRRQDPQARSVAASHERGRHHIVSDSTVSATLGQSIKVVPGVLVFDDFALSILPKTPVEIRFGCQAGRDVHGDALPKLSADVALSEASPRVDLQTTEPWKDPFGISGLTVTKLAVSMESEPAPKFGVLGIVTAAGKTIEVACAFTGDAPSLLDCQLRRHAVAPRGRPRPGQAEPPGVTRHLDLRLGTPDRRRPARRVDRGGALRPGPGPSGDAGVPGAGDVCKSDHRSSIRYLRPRIAQQDGQHYK